MPELLNVEWKNIEDERLNSNPVFTTSIGGFVSFSGFTLTGNFKNKLQEIDDLIVYDDDVWICTFPKSGTTWTQEMVWLLMNNFDYNGATKLLCERFLFLDESFLIDCTKLPQSNFAVSHSNPNFDSIQKIRDMKRPRCIKTHLPFQFLPRSIRIGSSRAKIIHVSRNVKDVCVSYYHHYRLLFGYRGIFEEFMELFLDGKVVYGPYWDNVCSYLDRYDDLSIMFLSFEEMKQNLRGVVERVSDFLAIEVPENQMGRLLEHLDIDSMRKNLSLNCEDVAPILQSVFNVEYKEKFIRKGKVGSFKEEMSEKSVRKFDAWIRENQKKRYFQQNIMD